MLLNSDVHTSFLTLLVSLDRQHEQQLGRLHRNDHSSRHRLQVLVGAKRSLRSEDFAGFANFDF